MCFNKCVYTRYKYMYILYTYKIKIYKIYYIEIKFLHLEIFYYITDWYLLTIKFKNAVPVCFPTKITL